MRHWRAAAVIVRLPRDGVFAAVLLGDRLSVRTCDICGCELSASDGRCPLCGASVDGEATASSLADAELSSLPFNAQPASGPFVAQSRRFAPAPEAGRPPAPQPAQPSRRIGKRALVLGLAAVSVAAAVVAVVLLAPRWAGDAEGANGATGILPSTMPASAAASNASGSDGNSLAFAMQDVGGGNAAGGGRALLCGETLFVAGSEGIMRSVAEQGAADEGIVVAADVASNLVWHDGSLYYIELPAGSSASSFAGTAVKRLDCSTVAGQTAAEKGDSSRTLYQAAVGATIDGLAIGEDSLFFVVRKDGFCSVVELPCDGSAEAREIATYEAEDAWVFIESGSVYVVSTTSAGWCLGARALAKADAAFQTRLTDEGQISCACFSDGVLYYAAASGGKQGVLQLRSESGAFAEFSDIANVTRLCAANGLAACVANGGDVVCVDSATELSYSLDSMVKDALPESEARFLSLGMYDEWLCVTDGKGNYVQYDMNTGLFR